MKKRIFSIMLIISIIITISPTQVFALRKPKAPQIVSIKSTKSSVVKLRWKKVPNVSGYVIYKQIGKKYKAIKTINSNIKTSYSVKNLESGKKHSFILKSFIKHKNKKIYSSKSNLKSITTKRDVTIVTPNISKVYNAKVKDRLNGREWDLYYKISDFSYKVIDNSWLRTYKPFDVEVTFSASFVSGTLTERGEDDIISMTGMQFKYMWCHLVDNHGDASIADNSCDSSHKSFTRHLVSGKKEKIKLRFEYVKKGTYKFEFLDGDETEFYKKSN